MTEARYTNFGHYIDEGWSVTPKQTFLRLAEILCEHRGTDVEGRVLDVGCATGELLGFLQARFPRLQATGLDCFDPLLEEAKLRLPHAQFVHGTALAIPEALAGSFDLITAMGVMSVFDESEIETFWKNLISVAKPDGLIAVLAPLNEYGVDTMIRHRKRSDREAMKWETGWNIHSEQSIRELLASLGYQARFAHFQFQGCLKPRTDPVRTWTLPTASNPLQLTNGLKLLVDHFFIVVDLRGRARSK